MSMACIADAVSDSLRDLGGQSISYYDSQSMKVSDLVIKEGELTNMGTVRQDAMNECDGASGQGHTVSSVPIQNRGDDLWVSDTNTNKADLGAKDLGAKELENKALENNTDLTNRRLDTGGRIGIPTMGG